VGICVLRSYETARNPKQPYSDISKAVLALTIIIWAISLIHLVDVFGAQETREALAHWNFRGPMPPVVLQRVQGQHNPFMRIIIGMQQPITLLGYVLVCLWKPPVRPQKKKPGNAVVGAPIMGSTMPMRMGPGLGGMAMPMPVPGHHPGLGPGMTSMLPPGGPMGLPIPMGGPIVQGVPGVPAVPVPGTPMAAGTPMVAGTPMGVASVNATPNFNSMIQGPVPMPPGPPGAGGGMLPPPPPLPASGAGYGATN